MGIGRDLRDSSYNEDHHYMNQKHEFTNFAKQQNISKTIVITKKKNVDKHEKRY